MNAKTISIFTFVVLCIVNVHGVKHIANAATPLSKDTVWNPVDVNLAQLLSSGWRI
jgi:hypothetical protein